MVVLGASAAIFSAEPANSHTVDEPGHLIRGLAWWWADDTRLSWPHPPLGQLIATAPVALFADRVDFEEMRGWDDAEFTRITRTYFNDFPEARWQLRIARITMGVLALFVLVYLYEWIRRRYGGRLALLTAVLFAANPVMLAHAGLMTTDFPAAALTLIAVLQLHDYLRAKSLGRVLTLAIAIGALICTKHTGIVISLFLLPPAVLFVFRGQGRFEGTSRQEGFRGLARDIAIVVLVALFCVNASYRFHDTGLSSAEIVAHPEPPSWLGRDALNARDFLPDGMVFPIPFNYLFGAEFIRLQNVRGHAGFFLGSQHEEGVPGYFPIMLAIKLPTGLLALLVTGFTLAARRRFARLPLDVWLHGWLVLGYLVFSFDAHVNIGVRHALPVVPSLACLGGRSANALWTMKPWGRLAALVCIASVVVGVVFAHPDYLADFNWLVGGRAGGHRVSVIGEDWGQDSRRLAEWQQDRDVPVSYYTQHRMRYSEVAYWGGHVRKLRCQRRAPNGSWAAVHLTDRVRRGACVSHYLDRAPDVVLNDHILLFAPEDP